MSDLTPQQVASVDVAYWVMLNGIILPNGPFTFKDHEYLREPLRSDEQIEVEQKATQGGFSVKETLVNVHGCINKKFSEGVAVAMPTETDVQKFSKTEFDPIIGLNPRSIGKYTKKGGKGVSGRQSRCKKH